MFDRQRILQTVVSAAVIALGAAFVASGKVPAFIGSAGEFFGLLPIENAVIQPFVTTVPWTDTGSSTLWYTSTNWTPNTGAAQWLATDVAQFNNAGSAITAGIGMATDAALDRCDRDDVGTQSRIDHR